MADGILGGGGVLSSVNVTVSQRLLGIPGGIGSAHHDLPLHTHSDDQNRAGECVGHDIQTAVRVWCVGRS